MTEITDERFKELLEWFGSSVNELHRDTYAALTHYARLRSQMAESTNYVANTEVAPTFIVFKNGRTVQIVDGALDVGWMRKHKDDDDSFAKEVLWQFRMKMRDVPPKPAAPTQPEPVKAEAVGWIITHRGTITHAAKADGWEVLPVLENYDRIVKPQPEPVEPRQGERRSYTPWRHTPSDYPSVRKALTDRRQRTGTAADRQERGAASGKSLVDGNFRQSADTELPAPHPNSAPASLLREAVISIAADTPNPKRPNKPMDFRSYEKAVAAAQHEQQPGVLPDDFRIALNVAHPACHKAADAFWKYWKENGETHKHGYYESTWGAINAALRVVGTVPHDYGLPAALPIQDHEHQVNALGQPAATETPRTDAWLKDGKAHYMMGQHCGELERELTAALKQSEYRKIACERLQAERDDALRLRDAAIREIGDVEGERDAGLALLRWLNSNGGLGREVHERIEAHLKACGHE